MVIVAGSSDCLAASGEERGVPRLPRRWDSAPFAEDAPTHRPDPDRPELPEAGRTSGSVLEGLVEKLVEAALLQWTKSPDGNEIRPVAPSVILDVECGRVRCILLHQPGPPAAAILSPRELEIARMVAMGHPNKTIASTLEISSWTVSSHLRRVFEKLGVSSRAAMATRLAAQAQPVGIEDETNRK